MQNVSIEHTEAIFNGHRVQGWAPVADALMLPDITLAEESVGPDGLMVVSSTGEKGGPVVFKLQANSPSTAFFLQQMAVILRGAAVEWSGTITNSMTGASTRCERGFLKVSPAGQTLGNGTPPPREFTLRFESTIPNYDGAQMQSPPVIN